MLLSAHGIATQLVRGNCVVGSSPTYPKSIINGMCQDIDKHNAIIDSYANNENGHRGGNLEVRSFYNKQRLGKVLD